MAGKWLGLAISHVESVTTTVSGRFKIKRIPSRGLVEPSFIIVTIDVNCNVVWNDEQVSRQPEDNCQFHCSLIFRFTFICEKFHLCAGIRGGVNIIHACYDAGRLSVMYKIALIWNNIQKYILVYCATVKLLFLPVFSFLSWWSLVLLIIESLFSDSENNLWDVI